jgi:hypothetical protein
MLRNKNISVEEQISNDEYMWNIILDDVENLSDVQKNVRRAGDYSGKMNNLYGKGEPGTNQEKLYNDGLKDIGHKNYFTEFNLDTYEVIIESLKAIGAIEHAQLLNEVTKLFVKTKNQNNNDLNKTLELLEDVLIDFDKKFDAIDANTTLEGYIQKYIDSNTDDIKAYFLKNEPHKKTNEKFYDENWIYR